MRTTSLFIRVCNNILRTILFLYSMNLGLGYLFFLVVSGMEMAGVAKVTSYGESLHFNPIESVYLQLSWGHSGDVLAHIGILALLPLAI